MVRVRIPPSPTGLLHIGTARTALYNYLFAKKNKGVMIFRIEDTDRERGTKEFEKDIIDGLVKLGIAGDEGVHKGGKGYRQSERTDIYKKYIGELLEKGRAYFCFCSKEKLEETRKKQEAEKRAPRYEGTCAGLDPAESRQRVEKGETAVVRLHVPKCLDIQWNDLVRGNITINSTELDDFVIARRPDDPLYNLTVVADDHDMQITHVIRGEDHIPNTPKQILIFRAFDWELPEFAHLPLILNEDKSKLSKRKNKVSVDDYLAEGILPEALLNFLALLGWNTPDEQEIFTLDELVEKFSLDRVHKGGAVFDLKRMEWINGEWIKRLIAENVDDFAARVGIADPLHKKILQDPDFAGRFKRLTEIPEAMRVFDALPDYDKSLLLNEKFGVTPAILKTVLEKAVATVEALEWKKADATAAQKLSAAMTALPTELGLKNGQVLWPVRAALSGSEKSPNFATLMVYLGKEETLRRLCTAL